MVFLSPYSPFLKPIQELFSAWRWKVQDHRSQDQLSPLAAMDAACDDFTAAHCRRWLRHARRFFPCCIAKGKISGEVEFSAALQFYCVTGLGNFLFFCIDVFLYYIVLCTFLCLLWCKTDTYIKRKYSNNFHGNVSAMYNVKHLASESYSVCAVPHKLI